MNGTLFKGWFETQFVTAVKRFIETNGLQLRALQVIDCATCRPSDGNLIYADIKVIFLTKNAA